MDAFVTFVTRTSTTAGVTRFNTSRYPADGAGALETVATEEECCTAEAATATVSPAASVKISAFEFVRVIAFSEYG